MVGGPVFVLLLLLGAAAAESGSPQQPDGVFFYNTKTGESTWNRPASMPILDEASGHHYWVVNGEATWVPPEEIAWISHRAPDGRRYYENIVTKETAWEAPEAASWTARSSTKFFWANSKTGETTWEKPPVLGHHSEEHNATYYASGDSEATWDPPVEAAWTAHEAPEAPGSVYYHNPKTQETTWELPPESTFAWSKHHVEM